MGYSEVQLLLFLWSDWKVASYIKSIMYLHRAIVLENIQNFRARPPVIIWKFRPLGRVGVKGCDFCIDSHVMVQMILNFTNSLIGSTHEQ